MRIALLTLVLAGCADEPPAKQDPAIAARLAKGNGVKSTLTPQQVVSALSPLKGRVAACYDQFKQRGTAYFLIVVGPEGGRPHSVTFSPQSTIHDDSPEGLCVLAVVRAAQFTKFAGEPASIEYPFMLR